MFSFQCPLADPWIVPIIQGFVQIEHCKVAIGFDPAVNEALEPRYEVNHTYVCTLVCTREGGRGFGRNKYGDDVSDGRPHGKEMLLAYKL